MTTRGHLQRKATTPETRTPAPDAVQETLRSGGEPLDPSVRETLEPRFGHDFGQVRVHQGDQAAASVETLHARAYTVGSDIVFGAGEYQPASRVGQQLIAHELTHVVQQAQGQAAPQTALTTSIPGDPAEREAESAATRVLAGETVRVSQAPTGALQGDWLDDAASAVGDALDMRDNEAALDEWEDYQDSMRDYRDFVTQDHTAENYQSTTRIGMFDAIYHPQSGELSIVVKCKFDFVNGSASEFPSASAADLAWTDQAAMDAWKTGFITSVSTTWSSGNHIFYCQKPWWEDLSAHVAVEVREVDTGEHFALTITKIPPGAFRTSSVTSPTVVPIIGQTSAGTGDFDSEDLNTVAKPGGMQTPAVHEAGHMLGLDDEYGTGTPSHSDMVEEEFGHGVSRGPDGRIMSGGNDIQPEHGITFLAALKEATGMDEWTATMCPVPRPIPTRPTGVPSGLEGAGDFPMPSGDTRPA